MRPQFTQLLLQAAMQVAMQGVHTTAVELSPVAHEYTQQCMQKVSPSSPRSAAAIWEGHAQSLLQRLTLDQPQYISGTEALLQASHVIFVSHRVEDSQVIEVCTASKILLLHRTSHDTCIEFPGA